MWMKLRLFEFFEVDYCWKCVQWGLFWGCTRTDRKLPEQGLSHLQKIVNNASSYFCWNCIPSRFGEVDLLHMCSVVSALRAKVSYDNLRKFCHRLYRLRFGELDFQRHLFVRFQLQYKAVVTFNRSLGCRLHFIRVWALIPESTTACLAQPYAVSLLLALKLNLYSNYHL